MLPAEDAAAEGAAAEGAEDKVQPTGLDTGLHPLTEILFTWVRIDGFADSRPSAYSHPMLALGVESPDESGRAAPIERDP
jgi:hypothetical protein